MFVCCCCVRLDFLFFLSSSLALLYELNDKTCMTALDAVIRLAVQASVFLLSFSSALFLSFFFLFSEYQPSGKCWTLLLFIPSILDNASLKSACISDFYLRDAGRNAVALLFGRCGGRRTVNDISSIV